MVTMLIELEDTLGIYFDPYDMDPTELITVNDVITMVKRYINEDSEETC
jgi:acyl carrier protein